MNGLTSIFENDSKKIRIILVLFLIVYHFVLFFSLSNQPVLLRDSEEYISSSKSFEINKTFYAGPQSAEVDYRLYSKRTPFYPIVLYTFRSLNLHLNFVYLLQLFLGLFNIYLALILLKQLIKKHSLAYIFLAFFILLTPSQFIYSQFIMADLWLQSFIMICIVSFAFYIKSKKSIWLISLILFSTLAALTKPIFLLASFVISLYSLIIVIKQNHSKLLTILVIIPFLSWFAICKQNEKLTEVFHYSSIGYINLLHYNTNLYLNKAIGKAETEKLLEPLMIVPHTKYEFKENYNQVNKVCKEALLSHIRGYFLYHCKGVAYFFLDPGRFDIYNFLRIEEKNSTGFLHKGTNESRLKSMFNEHPIVSISLVLIFIINVLKTFGFLGFLWLQRKNRLAWAGAIVIFYIAFLTGPLGASRFALPVELIIICFASLFFAQLFQNLKFWKKVTTN